MKLAFSLVIALSIFIACNKPSIIGNDFLDEDEIGIGSFDTLTLFPGLYKIDSLITYRQSNFNNTYRETRSFLSGHLNDPVFGNTHMDIFTEIGIFTEPLLDDSTLDSIVLSLALDTTSRALTYFDSTRTMSVEVHRVTEPMERDQVGYSHETYETGDLLGEKNNFTIRPYSQVNVVEPTEGASVDSSDYDPHIRIPLSMEFGQELINLDTTEYTTAPKFKEYFYGIRISIEGDALVPFTFQNSATKLTLYYTRNDDDRRYSFDVTNISNKRTVFIEHDYSGTVIEDILNGNRNMDTTMYMQGLAGLHLALELPNVRELPDNVIVNKAELILTVKPESYTEEIFSPSKQLITFTENSGMLIATQDVYPNFSDPRFIDSLSGGQILENKIANVFEYRVNLSSHIQRMIEGARKDTVFVGIHPNIEDPGRVILYGPQSQIHPARISVVYTVKP